MGRRLKILHVIANAAPRYGGPSKACLEMAGATAALGHEVSVFTTNQDGPGELDVPLDRPVFQDGVEIRFFPIGRPRFWGTSLPLARALGDRIREVDLVHVHSLYLFHDLVAGHYCRKYGVPYLICPHGALDPFIYYRHRLRKRVMELAFEQRNLKGAAGIHFITREEEELAAPFIAGARGLVVPLGIDFSQYETLPEPGRFRAAFPETGDRKMVLFLGRINFKKGLDLLVKAFTELARAREDVHLVVAGPDNDGWAAKVREWLAAAGMTQRATFTGMLLGADKLAAFRDSEVFVLPSYSENFGIAVVEAMACGLPVVISDKVNIWREVAAAGAGKVVPCDTAPLAVALTELLADPGAAREMGRRGRNLVQQHFGWDRVALTLEDAYYRILREHRQG